MLDAISSKAATLGRTSSNREDAARFPVRIRDASGVWKWGVWRWLLSYPVVALILISLMLGYLLVHYRESLGNMGNWGYLSVFVVEAANSAAVFIPTPGHVYTFALGATLDPLMLGLIGGIGATTGEILSYYLGTKARGTLQHNRIYRKLKAFSNGKTGIMLFTLALVPGPFEVVGLWAGTMRYPIWRFLFYVGAGKILKVTGIALAGYYSISLFF